VAYLLISFIRGFTDRILNYLPGFISEIDILRFAIEEISVAGIFFAIVYIGIFIKTVLGSKILKMIDGFYEKLSGIKRIYSIQNRWQKFFVSEIVSFSQTQCWLSILRWL